MNPVLENSLLRIEVDPEHGGRVTSFFAKMTQTELLWYDASRLPVNPALDYDGNFAGGMDTANSGRNHSRRHSTKTG